MSRKKAYRVWHGSDEWEWFAVLLADTPGRAKYQGMIALDIDGFDYPGMRCRRVPAMDDGEFTDRALVAARLLGWTECGNCYGRIQLGYGGPDDADDVPPPSYNVAGKAFCSARCHQGHVARMAGAPPSPREDFVIIGQE